MTILSERSGAVTTVVIDRPHAKNAVDGETAEALAQAFRDFEADPQASVAVLAGSGGTFCAGADLKAFGNALSARANPLNDDMALTAPMGPSRLVLSKPVIAAVDGFAVAGGMELALWCDLRVMEETATFGIFCRRWGVPLIDGGTVRLPRLIGVSRALDLILTGRAVHAQEALAMGLANRVVPPGDARMRAQELAAEIARFPQVCLRNDRASVFEQDGLTLEAALANEFRRGRDTLASGESVEGAARFAKGAGRGGTFEN
jgi:enoyl-CoA hydratase